MQGAGAGPPGLDCLEARGENCKEARCECECVCVCVCVCRYVIYRAWKKAQKENQQPGYKNVSFTVA